MTKPDGAAELRARLANPVTNPGVKHTEPEEAGGYYGYDIANKVAFGGFWCPECGEQNPMWEEDHYCPEDVRETSDEGKCRNCGWHGTVRW